MSTLYIREYDAMPYAAVKAVGLNQGESIAPIAKEPGLADQAVTYSTATQSSAFNTSTRMIRAISATAFHYAVGSNPTATTSSLYWPADMPLDIGVSAGHKISVVDAA